MNRAAASRSADLERHGRVSVPPMAECFELALRRVRAQLATRTGADAPIELVGVRAVELESLVNTEAADAVIWSTWPMAQGGHVGVIAIEGNLIAFLMGRLFGEGDAAPALWTPRAPTTVEKTVSQRLCRELMDALAGAWVLGPPPRFLEGKSGSGPRILAGMDLQQIVLCATLAVSEETGTCRLFVALPAVVVTPDVSATETANPTSRVPKFDRVMPVELELVVELARLDLPFGTLERLAPGDEIPLGVIGEVEGRVGGKPAFIGRPGITGGQRSFRVERRANSDSSSRAPDR